MGKEYVLWLDESGTFEYDQAKISLIGGVLLEKENAEAVDFSELIQGDRNHGTDLSLNDKKKYIVPALEKLVKDYGARLFYIENPMAIMENRNSSLYLRMMADGILQLMQLLNAMSESVSLTVTIAQRQDITRSYRNRRIHENEYIRFLKNCIEKKKNEAHILLHESSSLEFVIDVATCNPCLIMADYACNIRFARKSPVFNDIRHRLNALFGEAYIFTVAEETSESYIDRLLSQSLMAEAMFEVFITTDDIDKDSILRRICERMKNTDYRLVKKELNQFITDISSYAAGEDDYECGEQMLKDMIHSLIPVLKEAGYEYPKLLFNLEINLMDMYLREGDVLNARETYAFLKESQAELGGCMEEVFSLHRMIEKEAVLLIDEFRYEEAWDLMSRTCEVYDDLMDAILRNKILKQRFHTRKSEYYGDVLCMKIYAGMLMQREKPELYRDLIALSDTGMQQYPNTLGELERHRQYRSHIEMEAGHYGEALQWLMLAKLPEVKTIEKPDIVDFLFELTSTEYEVSCRYYLMYYLLIMTGAEKAGDTLAGDMFEALSENEAMLELSGFLNDSVETGHELVDLKKANREGTGINYHPLEVIHWKMASFLYLKKKNHKAIRYFESAYEICFLYSNYDTMRITGIGVLAEYICCLIDNIEPKNARKKYDAMLNFLSEIMNSKLPDRTKEFVSRLRVKADEADTEGTLSKDKLLEISDSISW